jgi:hypothetical protein
VEEGVRGVSYPKIPQRYYVVGDVITLRLELSHRQNIEEVLVVYARDGDRENRITFTGGLEHTETLPATPEGAASTPYHPIKRSTATLRMVVDVDHRPGSYALASLACRLLVGGLYVVDADDETFLEADPPTFRILSPAYEELRAALTLADERDQEQDDAGE